MADEEKVVYNKDGTRRKKMGRPKGKKDSKPRKRYRQHPAQQYSTWQPYTPQEIATSNKSLAYSKQVFAYAQERGKCDMKNADEMRERFYDYIDICTQMDIKPNVTGVASAFGVDRTKLTELHARRTKAPIEVYELVDEIYAFMNMYLEGIFSDGDIPTVNGIFLLKNHFGYKDQQEVVVAPTQPLGEDVSDKLLEEKYSKSVPRLEPMEATPFEVVKE